MSNSCVFLVNIERHSRSRQELQKLSTVAAFLGLVGHSSDLDVCMGSCSLSALIWFRPVILLFFLTAVLLDQAMTLENQSTSTLKLEAESVAPKPTVVAPILGKKPKMVSNSTQTDDFEPTAEPVLITGLILAVAAACSAILAVIVLVVVIVVAIRCYWDRPSKAPPFSPQYVPSDGQGYVPVYVDRKMAQSAQMFFYQFQKQQILAQESDQKSKRSADSDSCSETETKDGHMPMVSCPGLAMENGEDLEVRNPMFFEDVPTWNGSTAADGEESSKFGTADGTMTSQEETDVEANAEQRWTSVTLSAPFPRPPPSTPTSSTPTPSPSEESGPDAKTTDVNKNLTQVSREAEVKTRSTSDDP